MKMEKIKVFTIGAMGNNCQLPRINQGLINLGCEFVQNIEDAQLIYGNNQEDSWEDLITKKKNGKIKGKVILNILDLANWNWDKHFFDATKLFNCLSGADEVTTISKYVQGQILQIMGIRSTVIYNPIKDISPDERLAGEKSFPYRAMMVGRLRDRSKRAELAINSLITAGFSESEVAIVGSENIGWGTYLGEVSDDILNKLYNSVDYVLMTSMGEGLGLPALEACAGGAIPIICHDLTTFSEFYPKHWGCYPSVSCISTRIITLEKNNNFKTVEKEISLARGKDFINRFNKNKIAQNILDIYNKTK